MRLDPVRVAAAALLLAFVLAAAWSFDPFGRRRKAQEQLAAAEARLEVTTKAAAIDNRTAINRAEALKTAEEAKDEIDHAPDLGAALDRYGAGIDRVRAQGRAPVSGAQRR